MTTSILQIKAALGLAALCFVQQSDKDNKDVMTPWVAHWDNDKRIRVVMHNDVLAVAKADPNAPVLIFKSEVVAAHDEVAAYTRVVISTPRNIVATF